MAQKFHFAILRIEVTRASRGLSVIAELLVILLIREGKRNVELKMLLGLEPVSLVNSHDLDMSNAKMIFALITSRSSPEDVI